jgi:nucleoside-diphosphate-sugar epimerase
VSTILVTGAKGTVGSYVVGLAEAAGHRVIVSDRDPRGLRAPVRGEVRGGDITSGQPLDALVRGADIVVHTAAQLSVSADAAELARTNSDAVAALYEAAERQGATRFVHLSTATLYERGRVGETIREDARLAPTGPYSLSKHGAEAFLRGRIDSKGPAWTILRPAPIYGRRGRHFAASLLAFAPIVRLMTPVLPRMAGGPLGTMVHAEDVARAALFVANREDTRFEVFNVADGDVMSIGARLDATVDAYGLDSSDRIRLPEAAFRAFGGWFSSARAHEAADRAALAAWKLVVARYGLKPALRPHLDREAVPLLRDELVVDASKLNALGFTPRFSKFSEGFRETLRWYQSERWVPRYS